LHTSCQSLKLLIYSSDILESNKSLDFNAGTSNPDERHLKSLRVEDEEHPCREALSSETQEIHSKLSTLNVNEVDVSSIE
jgi:hypothetical protein